MLADAKGALLEHRLEKDSLAIVRLIPTRRMRAYFLVHGAYVPGLANIYLELLTPKGQDFCQLHLSENGADEEATMTFTTLLEDLSQGRPPVIPFALKLGSDHPSAGLLLNPQGAEREVRFRPSQIEAIYAVGETQRFPR